MKKWEKERKYMEENKKQRIAIFIFFMLLITIPVLFLLLKKEEYSLSERRVLKEFPRLSITSIVEGEFGEEFEEYTLDHFPFRESFRTLKACVSKLLFHTRTENGLYKKEGYLVKMEYPLNQDMVDYATKKFQEIYDTFLEGTGSQCYFAIVPDKNYFLAKPYHMLSMDYEKLFSSYRQAMPWARYIDLTKVLTLEDYYKTDTHWRQENLEEVALLLGKTMGVSTKSSYKKIEAKQSFYGVYAGQWSLPIEPEKLCYLTNPVLEGCKVTSMEGKNKIEQTIYNLEKVEGKDPYDLFLSGPQAIQIIENPQVEEGKELLLFRDSFGSSLAPLLLSGYAKITLIDLRYVQSKFLDRYVQFEGQDVLFLYSTLILNQSRSLR